tara:strand:- start:165 stop:536 length:372 start_codon:yes stop_codon:yes gene_type:complete
MTWKRKNKRKGRNQNFSIIRKFRNEGKINEEFEVRLGGLTLEEIIAVKLELAAKSVGGKLYGFPIWKSLNRVVKDAVLKYALSATQTKMEAARLLGVSKHTLYGETKKYGTESFFEKDLTDEG